MFNFIKDAEKGFLKEMEGKIEEGLKQISLKNNEKAVLSFIIALKIFEKNVEEPKKYKNEFGKALVLIGHNLFRLNEVARALDAINYALKIDPKNQEAWYEKGIINLSKADTTNYAIICFKEVLKLNPDHIEALKHCGDAYRILGDYKNAINYYLKIIELKKDPSINDYDTILKLDENNEIALYGKARVYEKKENFVEALKLYEKLYNINPDKTEYKIGIQRVGGTIEKVIDQPKIGKVYVSTENVQPIKEKNNIKNEAWDVGIVTQSKEDSPHVIEKIETINELLEKVASFLVSNKYDYAIEICKAFLVNHDDDTARVKLIELLVHMERFEEAYEVLSEIKDTAKINNIDFLILKGKIGYNLKKYDFAVDSLNNVIKLNPNIPEAWYIKGLIDVEQGQYERAINFLKMAVKLHPEYKKSFLGNEKLAPLYNNENFKKILL
ncbi:MAG: tetratricopeptide repeat protein [Thermoplasmata archaeon]